MNWLHSHCEETRLAASASPVPRPPNPPRDIKTPSPPYNVTANLGQETRHHSHINFSEYPLHINYDDSTIHHHRGHDSDPQPNTVTFRL